jgi:hypothetical protein
MRPLPESRVRWHVGVDWLVSHFFHFLVFLPLSPRLRWLCFAEKHHIVDERKALEDVLVRLERVLSQEPFLSLHDEVPNLDDLIVFGTLRCIEGLPVHDRFVMNRPGPIRDWYGRMKEQVAPVVPL